MSTLDLDKLTPEQRSMVALWDVHLKAELRDKNAHASCDTMVANPYVNHVAVLTGGVGWRQLENYYSRYFIPGQPPDLEIVPKCSRAAEQRARADRRLAFARRGRRMMHRSSRRGRVLGTGSPGTGSMRPVG